jgi:putative hemolysin
MREIIVLFILILLNFFFALAEITFISSKKIKILDLYKKGDTRAKLVLSYMKEPEKYLSSIQVWITLIWIISGAFWWLALSDNLSSFLQQFPFIGIYSHQISIIIIVSIITYFSIVIGELLPKLLWLRNPEKIILFIIPVVNIFTKIFYPFVLLLSFSIKTLFKIIKFKKDSNVVDDPIREIVLLTQTALNNNKLNKRQSEMLFNAINLSKISVGEIILKKEQIIFINNNMNINEIISLIKQHRHTRYPLIDTHYNVLWYINIKDLLFSLKDNNEKFDIHTFVRDVLFYKETEKIINILPQLLENSQHIAMVKNSDGEFIGMITLENIIESIVWEINDEYDM